MMLAGVSRALAPVAGAFSAAQVVSTAADFESAMTGIQKKAGTSADETARLGEEIKALATSGELAVPIEEIIGAYERGAAAGIPIAELKQFARLSVKAADAFEMPAEEVGNFAAKLKTSMGLSEDAIRRVFDLTNSLADAGIADEKDIVNFVDRTGASLKTLGLSINETLAVGSTMLNLGMSSEVASTAMDALSSKMLTVNTLTGKGKKTFEKYMGPVDDFSKLIEKDANGALLKMLNTIQSLNGEQRMDFLSQFVGQDHAGKILRLSDAVREYLRNLELANNEAKWFGSLDAAYTLKLDDFWSQWQLVKNALEKLAIDTGTMGMPTFKAALDGALALIKEVDGGLKAFQAKVDTTELARAMDAVTELGGKIGEIAQLGGTGDTPITKFFDRLAQSANLVSGSMNIARDVLESVGLAKPDADTSKDRQQRRDSFVDTYAAWNPLAGPVIKGYRDWAGADAPERNSRADEERDRSLSDFVGGPAAPIAAPARALPAERGGRIERAVRPFAPPMPAPVPAPAFEGPLGRSSGAIAIPTPRPDIVGPVTQEGEEAALKARELGSRISEAFSVTATPQINSGSIDAFILKVRTARSELDALNAAGARGPRGGGVDYSGLHEDIEN